MNLSEDKKISIRGLPIESKWNLILSHKKSAKVDFSLTPQQYMVVIQQTLEVRFVCWAWTRTVSVIVESLLHVTVIPFISLREIPI